MRRARTCSATAAAAVALVLCALLCCVGYAEAFRFNLPVNTGRCFVEEIPSNTEVTISYVASEAYAQYLTVTFVDPQHRLLITDTNKNAQTHKIMIEAGGDYKLCFMSSRAGGVARPSNVQRSILVHFKTGADQADYKRLATTEKLKPIEVQVRALEDMVGKIHGEYMYFKEKEAEMRNTNERITARVRWLSIVLMVVFVAFSFFELRHLKSYFRKKRMID